MLMAVPPILAAAAALLSQGERDQARQALLLRLTPARLSLEQFRTAMIDQETGLRGFLLTKDQVFLEPFHAGRARADTEIGAMRRYLRGYDSLRDDLVKVEFAQRLWQSLADGVLADPARADDDPLNVRSTSLVELRSALDRLENLLEGRLVAAASRFDATRNRQQFLVGAALSTAVIGALLGAGLLTRWLRAPLARLERDLTLSITDPDAPLGAAGPAEVASVAGRADELRRAVLAERDDRVRRGLLVAQEEERRRIAGELHDDVIQSLAAIVLRLDMAASDAGDEQRPLIEGAQTAAAGAIDRLRQMVFVLHPPALERHGLVAAIETFGLGRCEGSSTEFRVAGDAGQASSTVAALAYRVAREAVINACEHADADTITVTVEERDAGLACR